MKIATQLLESLLPLPLLLCNETLLSTLNKVGPVSFKTIKSTFFFHLLTKKEIYIISCLVLIKEMSFISSMDIPANLYLKLDLKTK